MKSAKAKQNINQQKNEKENPLKMSVMKERSVKISIVKEKKESHSQIILKKKPEKTSSEDEGDFIPLTEILCTDPYMYAAILKTEDITAIIQACDELYEYIIKNPDIGENLIEKGIVESVLNNPPNSYPYYNGARYRLLSKLYEMYPQTRPIMKARIDFLRMAIRDAVETEDVPLKDYALLYFFWLSKNFKEIFNEFTETYGLKIFFTKFLPEPDVDVKYNSLGVLLNLLECGTKTQALVRAERFSFTDLVDQCSCPYPAIQNRALDIISLLINRKQSEMFVHKMFLKAGGLEILLQILNVFQWRDIHAKVFKIFRILFRNSNNISSFQKLDGLQRLVHYVHYVLDDSLMEDDLQTIFFVARTYEGKMTLINENVLNVFLQVLKNGSPEAMMYACEGIRWFTEGTLGIFELVNNDPSKIVNNLFLDKNNSLELRCNCASTLCALVLSAPLSKLLLAEPYIYSGLVNALRQPLQLTVDCLCTIMETISKLLSSPIQLDKILPLDLTKNLLALLDVKTIGDSAKIKLAQFAAEVLTWTLSRKIGRDWFTGLSGVNKVMKLLYKSADPVLLNNIGLLLRMVVEKDPVLTESFIKTGLVKWLIDNNRLWKTSPRLETATEALFGQNLPLKLEFWGRLETTDIITDGFYCCRFERKEPFPLPSEIARSDVCYARPVYVIYLGPGLGPKRENSIPLLNVEKKPFTDSIKYDDSPQSLNIYRTGIAELNEYSKILIGKAEGKRKVTFNKDVNLSRLYTRLKEQIYKLPSSSLDRTPKFNRQWVQERADLIAKCVAEEMSGRSDEEECNYHTFQLHMADLKMKLSGSLIPLGELKLGMKLERALLFKVLADRFGLPCALVRGCNSVAWVEVAAPLGRGPSTDLPSDKLTTNHLVDLVVRPGRLIPLSTLEAVTYCGQPMPGVLDKQPRHLPERKPAWMLCNKKKPDQIRNHVEIF